MSFKSINEPFKLMSKKKITLGIIGDGYHFKKNIRPIIINLKKKINLKIFILKKKNNKYNYNNFFKKKLDICYISTPTKTHFYLTKICLDNNISVISEKPLCETFNQAKFLVNRAKNKDLFLTEAFMFIYHPVFKYLKKIIDKKKSDLLYVKSEFTIPSLDKKNNRYDLKKGGGFYNDLAIYPISLENFLFNNSKILKKKNFIYSEKKIPLRGFLNFNSNNFDRFYFWGEGNKYKNNISLVFKKFSIDIDNFYSKNHKLMALIDFNGNNYQRKINFPKCNQFYEMFSNILINFNKKKYRYLNYQNILNLAKIKNQL